MSLNPFKQKTEQTRKPWQPVDQPLRDVISRLETIAGTTGPYTGDYVAPINSFQKQGWDAAFNAGQSQMDAGQFQMDYGRGLTDLTNRGTNWLTNYMRNGGALTQNTDRYVDMANVLSNNPYINDMIGAAADDIGKYYGREVLPGITGQAGQLASTDNSKYAQQFAQAGADMGSDIFNTSMMFRGDQYNRGMGYAMDAAAMDTNIGINAANTLVNTGMYGADLMGVGSGNMASGANNMMMAGDYRQGLLGDQLMNDQMRQSAPMDYWANYANILNGIGSPYGTTTGEQSKNFFGGMLGIGTQLAGAAIMAKTGKPPVA